MMPWIRSALSPISWVMAATPSGSETGDRPVEMLRVIRIARTSAVKSRTQAINQAGAVIVGAGPALRESLSGLTGAALIRCCANLPDTTPTDAGSATDPAMSARRCAARTSRVAGWSERFGLFRRADRQHRTWTGPSRTESQGSRAVADRCRGRVRYAAS